MMEKARHTMEEDVAVTPKGVRGGTSPEAEEPSGDVVVKELGEEPAITSIAERRAPSQTQRNAQNSDTPQHRRNARFHTTSVRQCKCPETCETDCGFGRLLHTSCCTGDTSSRIMDLVFS